MIKAVIFDVYGALAETEEAHRAAFNTAVAEFGLDWSRDKTTYSSLLTVIVPSFCNKHPSFSEAAAVLPDLSIDLCKLLEGLRRRQSAIVDLAEKKPNQLIQYGKWRKM